MTKINKLGEIFNKCNAFGNSGSSAITRSEFPAVSNKLSSKFFSNYSGNNKSGFVSPVMLKLTVDELNKSVKKYNVGRVPNSQNAKTTKKVIEKFSELSADHMNASLKDSVYGSRLSSRISSQDFELRFHGNLDPDEIALLNSSIR